MRDDPSVGLPDGRDPHRNAVALAALTMIMVVFLALVGQGFPPREAAAVTVALGLGGAEAARRLARGQGDGSEDKR